MAIKVKDAASLAVAVLAILTAFVQYRAQVVEATARQEADTARVRAESVAREERARREALQARMDAALALDEFLEGYRMHLQQVRSALSRLRELRGSAETAARVPAAENDVKAEVAALVDFVNKWRAANEAMARFLDGNIRAADAAALQERYDEIERVLAVLERTFADLQPLLEQAVRGTKESPAGR
jgi:hypothetical protein